MWPDARETQQWGDSSTLEFHDDPNFAWHSHHNPDGSEWISTCEYDDAGKLLTVRSESGGALVGLTLYEYDAAGRLVRVLYRPQTGDERMTESNEYSATGCRKKTHYVDLAAHSPNTNRSWGIEGTDTAYSTPGAVTLSTYYNEWEQPTEVHFLDSAGFQVSCVDLLYDEAGRLVEAAQTHSDEVLPSEMLRLFGAGGKFVRRTHRYDDQGRRMETRFGVGPLGGDITTMAYNEHGDLIQEIQEREEREFGMDDRGRLSEKPLKERVFRSEARMRYEYDADGNWVLKTVENRGGTEEEFTLSSVERRRLTYFERGDPSEA